MSEVILNLLPLTPEEQAGFRAAAGGHEQRFVPGMNPQGGVLPLADPAALEGVTILLGNLSPDVLRTAPGLRWLQTWSAGVDAYIKPGALPGDTMVTSAVGAYGPSVSEHMFAMLLALMKNLHRYRDIQGQRLWPDCDFGPVVSFVDFRVLVVGAGDIGLSFAALCKGVGMRTVGLKRTVADIPPALDAVHLISELDAWLPWADAVLLVVPHAPETVHLMDGPRLALMRPGAFLLNGGRGSAIDPTALGAALRAGALAGAALDVTEPEPLPPGHPLWDAPNLLLTPHVAGGLHLAGTRERIVSIALENLKHFLAGEPLLNRMK